MLVLKSTTKLPNLSVEIITHLETKKRISELETKKRQWLEDFKWCFVKIKNLSQYERQAPNGRKRQTIGFLKMCGTSSKPIPVDKQKEHLLPRNTSMNSLRNLEFA